MIHNEQVQWQDKGFWYPDGTVGAATFVDGGHSLFDGSFTWPVMVLRESALEHNLQTLGSFAERHDLLFAPHGKTTMAPALLDRQLRAGAWGISLATANQVAVAHHAGVRRILVANEVLDVVALTWMARLLREDPDLDLWCCVDSPQGVDAVSAAAVAAGLERGFGVLLDLGYPGGRTGCRDVPAALEVVRAVGAAPGVLLAGVFGYEGGLGSIEQVTAYLREVQALAGRLHGDGLLDDNAIVTAGGSSYFDLVADLWATGWPERFTPRKVLRSGAYLSHDDGVYTGRTPYNRRPEEGRLEAVIEVWAQVISPGDAGRVIVGLGKRDAPYDEGLPIPLRLRRAAGLIVEPLQATVEKLDDHHAYLVSSARLVPGDLVCFGISHPCTAFDKWRLLPVLDDDDRVVDLVRTFF